MHYNNCNQIIAQRKVINCNATINQFLFKWFLQNTELLKSLKKSKRIKSLWIKIVLKTRRELIDLLFIEH